MRLGFLAFLAVTALLLALATAWALWPRDVVASAGWGGSATVVAVEPVVSMPFADRVEALGTVRAAESVNITAGVSDTIARVAFESGDRVREGDLLVQLASGQEAAELNEARTNAEEARRDFDRIAALTERGVAPRQRLDEARAMMERAEARVRSVGAQLTDRTIRAPFSGVIGLRNVSVGQLIRPGDVIATLDDLSVVDVDFTVPEQFLSAISTGAQVEAISSAYPDRAFEGVVQQVGSRVDPVTRSVTVRAEVENEDLALLPGMLLTVELLRNQRESLSVPALAVYRRGPEAYVYVVQEGERGLTAEERSVVLGARLPDRMEVREGLAEGERVVSKGVHRVRAGAPVTIAGEAPAMAGRPGARAAGGAAVTGGRP